MIGRIRIVVVLLLVSIDQFFQVLFVGMAHVVNLGPAPSADETISSKVGRNAIQGRKWALIFEVFIDRLFVLLGEQDGHCRRNVETAIFGCAPTP